MDPYAAQSAQQPPSVKALGKRRAHDVRAKIAPSALVFVPKNLRRFALGRSQAGRTATTQPAQLVGWFLPPATSDNVAVIVVAGAVAGGAAVLSDTACTWESAATPFKATVIGKVIVEGTAVECGLATSVDGRDTPFSDNKWKTEIVLRYEKMRPKLVSLHLALPVTEQECAIHIIEYSIPSPDQMRYFSLEPMVLPIASHSRYQDATSSTIKAKCLSEKLERLICLDPLRFAELIQEFPYGEAPGERFRLAVELLNRCKYLLDEVENNGREKARRKGTVRKQSENLIAAAKALALPIRAICSIANFEIQGQCLSSLSLAVGQLELRLNQVLSWPAQSLHLRSQRLEKRASVALIAPAYTSLYNGIWLVGNDLILGQAVGAWLRDNHAPIAARLAPLLQLILTTAPIESLAWLDSWPAGVKLNSQLSRFFRDVFSIATKVCSEAEVDFLTRDNEHNLQQLVLLVSFATRWLGLSMLLALVVDLSRLLTLHLTTCYNIQRNIFVFFCSSLRSLFHLFRGKKRNPLRSMRVDNADYELDQLLLGTLFFTLFAFLWLTVAVYYAYFGVLRLTVVTIAIVLQTLITMLNHLPLFALMLRLKDPLRLPGGVAFKFEDTSRENGNADACDLASTYSTLESVPLSLGDIFRGYYRHLDGLRGFPRRILDVVQGRQI